MIYCKNLKEKTIPDLVDLVRFAFRLPQRSHWWSTRPRPLPQSRMAPSLRPCFWVSVLYTARHRLEMSTSRNEPSADSSKAFRLSWINETWTIYKIVHCYTVSWLTQIYFSLKFFSEIGPDMGNKWKTSKFMWHKFTTVSNKTSKFYQK